VNENNKIKEILNDIVEFYFEMHKLGFDAVSLIFLVGLFAIWWVFGEMLDHKTAMNVIGAIWILLMSWPLLKAAKKEKEEMQVERERYDY